MNHPIETHRLNQTSTPARGVVGVVGLLVAMALGQQSIAHADRSEARALLEAGVHATRANRNQLALEKFVAAINRDPDYIAAYDAAVPLWLAAGDIEALTGHLERATTRQRDYAFGWYTLGYAYRRTGRFELSVIAYEVYIALRPHDPDPRFGLALSLIELNTRRRAVLELQRYLKLEKRPERRPYVERARELVVSLGGVVPLDHGPRDAKSELDRARVLIEGLRFASALAVLRDLQATSKDVRGAVWLLRARAHLGAGRLDDAIAAGFIALGLRGGDSATLTALANAFDELGSRGAVGTYFRSLIDRR